MERLINDFANLNLSNKLAVVLLFLILLGLSFIIPVLSAKKKAKEKE